MISKVSDSRVNISRARSIRLLVNATDCSFAALAWTAVGQAHEQEVVLVQVLELQLLLSQLVDGKAPIILPSNSL